MSEPEIEVLVPLKVDLNNYESVAVVIATCGGRIKPKDCYNAVDGELLNSPLSLISSVYTDRKMFRKNNRYLGDIINQSRLYVSFRRSFRGYDEVIRLTIKDYQNNTIFQSNNINIPLQEVLYVLTDF